MFTTFLSKKALIKHVCLMRLAHKFPLGGSEDKDRRVEIKIISK